MRLTWCGVRGSTPAPGTEFVRYGGHTSCVAISAAEDLPTLVLDAGTGLRRVTELLGGRAFHGHILLSHLHWDHVQGLPFFEAGDHPDAVVSLLLPAQDGEPRELLGRAMSPPHFPIGPQELRGAWDFNGLEEGHHEIGVFDVLAREIPHKGGRTFGYRVSHGGVSVAYLPDHDAGQLDDAAADLAREVDLLIHDAQFTSDEVDLARRFGHATVDEAIELAHVASVGQLVLFHHAPARRDDQMDVIASGAGVLVAVEGQAVDVGTVTRARWDTRVLRQEELA